MRELLKTRTRTTTRKRIETITQTAVFIALIAVCAWITVPMPTGVPVTMQTFAVFFVAAMLSPKQSAVVIAGYIMLGAIGVPVFSSFGSGFGHLLGLTGGYITGFLLAAPLAAFLHKLLGNTHFGAIAAMIIGLFVCYSFGGLWFWWVYTKNTGAIGLGQVAALTIIPYIIPDIIKITLAVSAARVIDRNIHKLRL